MMCFHGHDIRRDLVLHIISLVIYSNIFLRLNAVQVPNREHSSITLYQGTDKYYLDAKNCPVGLTLVQPEIFSCACVNGIWAFYENPCNEPIAIVGGSNHCFQMPTHPIRMAIAVSNPLRAMGEFLTVFEGNMNGIRSKIYRNVRMRLTDADKFITLNSSWTLTSPDGSKSICLETKNVIFEGLTDEEAAAFPDASYCSYSGLSNEMPFIGGVKKGCNSSMVIEAVQCQPMLPNIGEEVCMSEKILKDYQQASSQDINLDLDNELQENVTNLRSSRSLKNLGRFMEDAKPTQGVPEAPLEVTAEVIVHAYKGEPEWHRRIGTSSGSNETSSSFQPISAVPKLNVIDFDKAWKCPQIFLMAPPSNSNILVSNHLWMYRRVEIRNVLNITRLVPPEDDSAVQVETGKVKKLLSVHRDIIKKICPLVPSSFFDTVAGTFEGVLTKGFRWKEPFVEQTHYLRILTSLSLCKNNAVMMKFAHSEQCGFKQTSQINLPAAEGNDSVIVQYEVPGVFRTKNFEPVIEAVWKTFVTVHSYCFKDFEDQYQDHHKYTMLMMGLFSNQLHDIWSRNESVGMEYAGILGNVIETMRGLENCAAAARLTSEYPFHMNRPTKLSRYKFEEETITSTPVKRSKRSAPQTPLKNYHYDYTWKEEVPEYFSKSKMKILSRKKRLTVNSINTENRIGDTMFNGRGICLKRYGDQKAVFGNHCRNRNIK